MSERVNESVEFTAPCPECHEPCLWVNRSVTVRHPLSTLPVSVSKVEVLCECDLPAEQAA